MEIGMNLFGLVGNGIWDLRTRRISIVITAIYAAGGLALQMYWKSLGLGTFMALIPGIVCLLLAWITRQQIGYGDGFVLLAMGCNLSLAQIGVSCFFAFAFAGAAALFLLTFGRKKRTYEMPFVPFLLLGYLCTLWEG